MSVFTDQFTDTAGVDLLDHTPDLGDGYFRHDDYATAMLVTDANRVRNAGSGDVVSLYLADWTPPSADYVVRGRVRKLSAVTNHYLGLMGRASTDELTCYLIHQLTPGVWRLARIVAGVYTAIGSAYSQTLVDGEDYDVELSMSGTSIAATIDGVVRITATSGSITAAGRAGIISYVGVDNTTGLHLDSFEVAVEDLYVTYPTAGSILLVGTEYALTWVTVGTIPTVNIYVNGELIAEDVVNTGSYAWTPEQSQVTAAAVNRVESAADDSVFAESGEFIIATTTTSGGSVGRNRVPIQPAY